MPARFCACVRLQTRYWPKHSGQKLEKVEKDVERDFIMNSQQAKEYGIIDDIIYKTARIKTGEGYDRFLPIEAVWQKSACGHRVAAEERRS